MNKAKISWIKVSDKNLPEATERGQKETKIVGASDRVLVYCNDGTERFARFFKVTGWIVEGCCGQPDDFVTHFAFLSVPAQK